MSAAPGSGSAIVIIATPEMKTPQRKVISHEIVHGYMGYPSVCYTLSCGHTVSVKGYVFRHPKTKACLHCDPAHNKQWCSQCRPPEINNQTDIPP
jgi:hypothetical protein